MRVYDTVVEGRSMRGSGAPGKLARRGRKMLS